MRHFKTISTAFFVLLVSTFVLLAFSSKTVIDSQITSPENGYNIYAKNRCQFKFQIFVSE